MMPAHLVTRVPSGPPRDMLWTTGQFHYVGDLGMFEGRRVMLMDGVILEEEPMSPLLAIAATKTEDLIRATFGPGWHVRVAKPLVIGQMTDPTPDVAVVPGKPGDYNAHPVTAALVVEVSDSSLRYDTTVKLEVYAAGGIADYWVLDVNARELHVYRDPSGTGYATHQTLGPADSVVPLARPNGVVKITDLLP